MTTIYTSRLFYFFLSTFVLALGSLHADSIEFGQDLTASIDNIGDTKQYAFEAEEGDRILIRMRGNKNGVDACVSLLDPNGLEVGAECGTSLSEIRATIAISGTYKILAHDQKHNDTGDFGLTLEQLNAPSYASALSCAQSVVADLPSNGAAQMYRMDLAEGDLIRLIVQGGDAGIEPILELFDATGEKLTTSERDKGRAEITTFQVPAKGAYYLLMTDENGNDTGEFELGLQFLNRTDCSLTIDCSASIPASLTSQVEADVYRFKGAVGENIVISMRSDNDNIEPLLQLYNEQGELLASDAPTFGKASIENFAIDAEGMYTIVVSDQRYNDTGDYSFSFLKLNSVDCATKIDCNGVLKASLDERAEVDTYVFEGTEGDRLLAFMRGEVKGIESDLQLYDAQGTLVASSEARGRLARLGAFTLPSTGLYTLLAKDGNGNDTGNYFLTMRYVNEPDCRIELGCDNNGQTQRLSSLAAADLYTFEAFEAGEKANIFLEELEEHLEPYMELYDPNGRRLLSNDGREAVAFENVKLEEVGIYTLIVMDYEGNDLADYKLTIENAQTADCPEPEPIKYCEAKGTNTDYEWIEQIDVGGISNASGNDNGYGDYTSLSTTLASNQYHLVSLLPGFANPANPFFECWRIWIDLNQDGDFDDEGEMLFLRSSYGLIEGGIKIPATAAIGTTRMRIAMNYEAYPEQCGEFNYGEVEDYTIEIVPGSGCDALPAGWGNQDIGTPAQEGSVCYDDDTETYFIESSGKYVFHQEDEFHFAYTELCGDGEIVARVVGIAYSSDYAMGGVMMRGDLEANSQNASMLITPKGLGFFQARKNKGANTNYKAVSAGVPHWVKLTREGKKITGYLSPDGIEWEKVFHKNLNGLGDCLYAGLALTSNNQNGVLNTGTFDQVSVTPYASQQNTTIDPIDPNAQPQISLGVFPNPVADQAFVELKDVELGQMALIVLSNASGEAVMQEQRKYNGGVMEFDLGAENFLSGIYTLTVYYDGKTVSKQVIIAKE